MMKQLVRRFVVVAASAVAVTLLCGFPLIAQEPKVSQPPSKTAKRTFDPVRRLPPYFGQIGLSAEQKEAVYKIQGTHMPKIVSLEKQIEEMRAQMLHECEGVLKAPQKQLLEQRRASGAESKSKGRSTPKPQP